MLKMNGALDFLGSLDSEALMQGRKCNETKKEKNKEDKEKKKSEILQLLSLNPKFAILDETDSGLDVDALKVVATGINTLRSPERATILITHYQRLLELVVPDYVHVLYDGRIVKSGNKKLANTLDERGYDWVKIETENK